MNQELYYLTTLFGKDNPSSSTVSGEVARGEWEKFTARLVNGMVHQGFHQTGHTRPVGETTACRLAGDIVALLIQVGVYPKERKFDWGLFTDLIRLDAFEKKKSVYDHAEFATAVSRG